MSIAKRLTRVLAITAGLVFPVYAVAQEFPTRPITIVVPFSAGGGADIFARRIADFFRSEFGQVVVVENKPGAATTVASKHVANSAPDGHTLLMATASVTSINPVVLKNMPYKPEQLTGVALIAKVPLVFTARKDFPANNVKELIAYARANPGKITVAGQGTGATSHLVGERLKAAANLDLNFVQYKGVAQANADLVGGHIDLHVQGLTSALPLFAQSQAKAIAVTSETRMQSSPEIQTFEEAGLSSMTVYAWYGLLAPTGTPKRILDLLNAASNKALREPAIRDSLRTQAALPGDGDVEAFHAFLKKDIDEWRVVIEPLKLSLD